MNLHDALLTRRTIHTWRPGPVSAEALDRALQAAHHAPCHRLTWPWHFWIAGPTLREALVPITVAEKARKAPVSDLQADQIRRGVLAPGALVIVTQRLDARPDVLREDYAATSCAIQNLMLSLHADGYGTKWSTGGATRSPDTLRLLALDPAEHEIIGFVWVGLAAEVPTIRRPPLADHVTVTP